MIKENKKQLCPSCKKELTAYLKFYWECRSCNKKQHFHFKIKEPNKIIVDSQLLELIVDFEQVENQVRVCSICNEELSKNVFEYQFNRFLKLKKKKIRTDIYVNNKHFWHCKYLILQIPKEEFNKFEKRQLVNVEIPDTEALEMSKVNEVIEAYYHPYPVPTPRKNNYPKIPIDVEFWGHCSNMQSWVMNDYRWGILNWNLSFMLLKQLKKEGDPIATRVYYDEINDAFSSTDKKLIEYMVEKNFLEQYDKEDLEFIANSIEDDKIKKKIKKQSKLYHRTRRRFNQFLLNKYPIELFLRLSLIYYAFYALIFFVAIFRATSVILFIEIITLLSLVFALPWLAFLFADLLYYKFIY